MLMKSLHENYNTDISLQTWPMFFIVDMVFGISGRKGDAVD